MSSYRDQVSFSFEDGHKRYRWLLASPAERILATVADLMCAALAAAPAVWVLYPLRHTPKHEWTNLFAASPLLWLATCLLLVFFGIQAVWLATRGQTIGKRLMNIRIIRSNGHPANFMNSLVLRTLIFNLLCVIMIGGTLMLAHLEDNFKVYELIWIPYVVSFIMLFQTTDDHRTLQDRLAATVIVKARMRQEA